MDKQQSQRGFAWPLALVLLALITTMVVPLVGWSASHHLAVQNEERVLKDRYTSGSGVEHALWRIQNEAGFVASLSPSVVYSQNFNGRSASITVNALPTPTPAPAECVQQSGGHVCVTSSASPRYVSPNVLTTVTYSLSIYNSGTSTIHFAQFGDLLPAGFTFVTGSVSSSGIYSSGGTPYVLGNPSTSTINGRQELTWTFGSPAPRINSGGTGVIVFQASATPPPGSYYNQAWAWADPDSIDQIQDILALQPDSPVVAEWPKYDITSTAAGSTVKARVEQQDSSSIVRSWQVE